MTRAQRAEFRPDRSGLPPRCVAPLVVATKLWQVELFSRAALKERVARRATSAYAGSSPLQSQSHLRLPRMSDDPPKQVIRTPRGGGSDIAFPDVKMHIYRPNEPVSVRIHKSEICTARKAAG